MFARIDEKKLPLSKPPMRDTRIACILDEFSMANFEPEADFLELTPSGWRNELESFKPEVLFVESAWRGKDNLWTNVVAHCGPDILGIINWCKSNKVPTVFWNKEDPVHFTTFLNLASYFDVVLTTDLDSVPRYKQLLEKDSVYFFPFAAQLRNHNPIAKFTRADAFCFAGSYYKQYSQRTAALESFVEELSPHKPFVIFDRNFRTIGTQHEDYRFPESYQDMILGRLEPEEIEYAYKGFTTGINLNSVTTSQTMLARRVFELIASNTLVVSNYSRALETLFGELVLHSDRGETISSRLSTQTGTLYDQKKLQAQALRKVLREHTYRHRTEQLLGYVGIDSSKPKETIGVLTKVEDQAELDRVMSYLRNQTKKPDQIVVVTEDLGVWKVTGPISLYTQSEAASRQVSDLFNEIDLLSIFDPRDYYGPNYLEDLYHARTYVGSPMISKNSSAYNSRESYSVLETHNSNPPSSDIKSSRLDYSRREGTLDQLRRALTAVPTFDGLDVGTLISEHQSGLGIESFTIDSFEYLEYGAREAEDIQLDVQSSVVEEGFSLTELQSFVPEEVTSLRQENSADLATVLEDFPVRGENFSIVKQPEALHIESTLDAGKHTYIYSKSKIHVSELPWVQEGHLYVEASPGLDTILVLLFFDADQNRLQHVMCKTNTNLPFTIPEGAEYCQLGFRIMGPGTIDLLNIYPHPYAIPSVGPKTKRKHIVITNIYPSYGDLYRNAFVHSRVMAYKAANVDIEVIRLVDHPMPRYREFNGVSVLELNKRDLQHFLQENDIETVFVHFLNQDMYDVLINVGVNLQVYVWVHGSEIQPWWRRQYNATTPEQLALAKKASAERMIMWRKIFGDLPSHFVFVFVSQYFANEVFEDVGISLPEGRYQIIHNPIDTEVFNYVPKPTSQRKKVLSIRPYASRKYANDLSVEAVKILSQETFFHELEFRFIGDGPLFEETLEPITHFPNVIVERRFLNHDEIAAIHKDYGVLLTPTRMDAQGVSRDEAMSSGLVPLTTNVAAIPEFVDEESGFLAPLDDAHGLAQGIIELYKNPDLFKSMSESAARRVRKQSDKNKIIAAELRLACLQDH